MEALKSKLLEKSTIVTILTVVAGLVSWKLSPENADTIGSAVIIVLTAVGVITPEKKPE